jgi:hypothetical protein
MSDFKPVMLTLRASWETFWRMVALIVTDVLGETSSRFEPLVKWICQERPIRLRRESVVRMRSDVLTGCLLTPTPTRRSAVCSGAISVESGGWVSVWASRRVSRKLPYAS